MKAAAIYARVSSEQQKEENTIASQTAALIDFAREQGYSVPDEWVIEDEGFSGASLLRPGLERLRDLAAEGHIQTVLIHSPDRLSRKYAYQVLLTEEFARHGVETIFLKAPHSDTPEDQLMLQFQGMIAEYERAQILERSRRGKRHRAKAGQVSVLCAAPYGYRYIRKTSEAPARYEIDAAEAEVVRLVYDKYTVGGLSIGAIARLLHGMGVPTRRRVRWERSVVWAILRNPAYKGTACFNKTQVGPRQKATKPFRLSGRAVHGDKSSSHERPRDEWIEIPVPAIVSAETFALAAERLADNKRFAPRRTIEPSIVQGLVSCRKCGYALSRTSARTSARKIHYYRCLGSDAWRHLGGAVCDSRPIRQDLLDQIVWQEVIHLIEDPTLIRAELDRRLDAARAAEPTKRRQEALERELTRIRKSMERLLTAYQEDLLSLDELRRRMPELRAREQSMQAERQAILDQAADQISFLRLAETLTAFLQRLRQSAETLEIAERQKVVRLLVKEVLVDNDTITIRHSMPAQPTPPAGNAPPSTGKLRVHGESYLLRSGSEWSAVGCRQALLMDVAEWLRGLGLEQYAPAFRANDIDEELLHRLTGEDLRELGVTSIGHRRRLLDAIATLGPLPNPPPLAGEGRVGVEAERRQLTVMFCDLVGSTPLSARFDPEDLREVIGAYHHCVADTVGRFAGFVAKYMGDGVLVYFGYPEAHEDDAERAVRAGLAVIDAVGRLATPEPLNVRLGVASGLVVVGDLIGAGAAQERGVVGETPNLAARLQVLAQPGTLVIAESTRRQIGALFEMEDLGPQKLAGFGKLQHAWRVAGESGIVSRFEALRSEATPLVGRDEELDLLLRRWHQAKAGEGRVVLISGEPGIGKSRLTAELSQRIESDPHTRLRYFCSPHHQDSALYPFITQLERAAGFTRDDTAEQKLGKLRELLAPGTRDDEVVLLAELLSLPSSAADLNLSPQRKREMLLETLLHQVEAVARSRPVLMIFEDAHWIDPTSRELLDLILDRVARMPVLLVVTLRPELQHGWGGEPHVTALSLNRLAGGDGAMLVERLAGNAGLARETVDEIVERADGVPLFVEELTKAILETNDRVLSVSAVPDLAIPPTLHASLIARLDRLGSIAKEVAQVGSVIGREFGYDLVEQVAQRPAPEVQTGLGRLTQAGLLFCRGVAPESTYLFKHALVQDAAYGTLLRTRRHELHARVAAVLRGHFADLIERQPELLAHHLTAAGETERAVDQWLKAGRHAAARSADLEAIRHFERGLATLAGLSEGRPREQREIELQLARGLSLFTTQGFGSAGAAHAYARARELAEQWRDPGQQFMAVYGLWQSANGAGRVFECRRLSDRLLQLTAGEADHGLRLQAHHSAWATGLFAGEPAAAREHCEAGRRLYDPERYRSHRLLYGGHDPGTCALYFGAQAHWRLGYPDEALGLDVEAMALAERLGHPFSLELALLWDVMLHIDRGEPELALRRLDAAEAFAAEQRLGFLCDPRFLRGAALSAQGAFKEAVGCLREGLASSLGGRMFRPYGLARSAEALARHGEHRAAIAAAREGLEERRETGNRQWEAELHRLEGVALVGLNQLQEAQTALEEALRIARRQRAKSYELRAATSLARLWGEQGRRAEARELLAPVYGWFTEGFDTADLKEAKALLDQLA